jgi:DNA-binding MarR family transcriptional regulator
MAVGRKIRMQVLGDQSASLDNIALSTCGALVRFVGKLSAALGGLVEPLGLTLSSSEVLVNLEDSDGICQQELCDRLLFTKGNICVIVHKLEEAGLVERKANPDDGRAYRLFITLNGRKLLAQIRPARVRLIQQAMSGLSELEQKSLHRYVIRAMQSLDPIPKSQRVRQSN